MINNYNNNILNIFFIYHLSFDLVEEMDDNKN